MQVHLTQQLNRSCIFFKGLLPDIISRLYKVVLVILTLQKSVCPPYLLLIVRN